jgi:rhamnosyltransferase
VRDDDSSDDTLNVITHLQKAYPAQITIVSDGLEPAGSAAANFFALLHSLDLSPFDYVAFADQDDIWLPDKLSRAVECISAQGGGGYSSNLLAWNEQDDTTWIMDKQGKQKKLDYLFQGASAGCTYVLDKSCAALVKERLERLNKPFCLGISHDWVIYAICRSAGFRWFHDDRSLIHYRQHAANVYGARPGIAGIFARLGMVKSGWYRNHILWLESVINNSAEERDVMAALKVGSISDQARLAFGAGEFRRQKLDVWKLRVAIALGLLRK